MNGILFVTITCVIVFWLSMLFTYFLMFSVVAYFQSSSGNSYLII